MSNSGGCYDAFIEAGRREKWFPVAALVIDLALVPLSSSLSHFLNKTKTRNVIEIREKIIIFTHAFVVIRE